MTFGERIRAARERREMSAKELAAAVGISPQYLNDVEKDRRNPPSDAVIWRLAVHLMVPSDLLHLWAGRLPPELRETDVTDAGLAEALSLFRCVVNRVKRTGR